MMTMKKCCHSRDPSRPRDAETPAVTPAVVANSHEIWKGAIATKGVGLMFCQPSIVIIIWDRSHLFDGPVDSWDNAICNWASVADRSWASDDANGSSCDGLSTASSPSLGHAAAEASEVCSKAAGIPPQKSSVPWALITCCTSSTNSIVALCNKSQHCTRLVTLTSSLDDAVGSGSV